MTPPDARQRRVLDSLAFEEWEHESQLGCGAKVREQLAANGWIERLPDLSCGLRRWRITDAGQAARKLPEPPKPKRPSLKMLPPLVRTIDTSTAKPFRKK